MLYGRRLTLRQVRGADFDALYDAHADIRNRGSFFPLGVQSESAFRRTFEDGGFWQKEEGMLLMQAHDGAVAGHIEFYRPVAYWDPWELSYQLYDARFAGKGYASEAVQLMVDYLFGTKKPSRIQLAVVPENSASRRVAEKCGFTLEGTARGAFFNEGRNQGLLIFSLLRDDPRPWHEAAERA